ncbi:hypothetical protein [Sinanaerobacter chloroacetimidivorans]|jgi:uncharacterized membrane protein YtjA (UPF0391 family)|uniref:Uncharacterized protein n=1 Tax=Sinanaerobacter chloroacetimidivorans TaxID=2818044 RepID=A0A8J8B0X0_9FIRM|nr:hypothetical protein [Sinanaerobacter chloroacetimidivorans]MBR0597202.1 hypothetical protein [Sinanaerobacter chloroacetimidivorans]
MAHKRRYCIYNKCIVEEISQRQLYIKKLVILVIGFFYLIITNTSFSFSTLALYIAPMFIDSSDVLIKLQNKIIIYFDRIIKIINFIIFMICLAGFSGLLIDNDYYFTVSKNALIFSGLAIKKAWICYILFFNLLEVIVLAIFVPGKNDSLAFNAIESSIHGKKENKSCGKRRKAS